MTRYNLYRDGQAHAGAHLLAVAVGSELDMQEMDFVGTVETDGFSEFSPAGSAFQSSTEQEYIRTGLAWPHHEAVVVR